MTNNEKNQPEEINLRLTLISELGDRGIKTLIIMYFKRKAWTILKKTQIRLLEMINRVCEIYNTLNLTNYKLDNSEKQR